jgi:hypothetical protein
MNKINNFAERLENVNWKYISLREPLTESFVEKFQDYIDWRYLSINQQVNFSQNFLIKFQDKLNISKYLERFAK